MPWFSDPFCVMFHLVSICCLVQHHLLSVPKSVLPTHVSAVLTPWHTGVNGFWLVGLQAWLWVRYSEFPFIFMGSSTVTWLLCPSGGMGAVWLSWLCNTLSMGAKWLSWLCNTVSMGAVWLSWLCNTLSMGAEWLSWLCNTVSMGAVWLSWLCNTLSMGLNGWAGCAILWVWGLNGWAGCVFDTLSFPTSLRAPSSVTWLLHPSDSMGAEWLSWLCVEFSRLCYVALQHVPFSKLSGWGDFSLGVDMVSDSTSCSFEWECKPRSCVCVHTSLCTDSTDLDIHVLDRWMPATKTHSACTIHENGMWLTLLWDKIQSHTQKSHKK